MFANKSVFDPTRNEGRFHEETPLSNVCLASVEKIIPVSLLVLFSQGILSLGGVHISPLLFTASVITLGYANAIDSFIAQALIHSALYFAAGSAGALAMSGYLSLKTMSWVALSLLFIPDIELYLNSTFEKYYEPQPVVDHYGNMTFITKD